MLASFRRFQTSKKGIADVLRGPVVALSALALLLSACAGPAPQATTQPGAPGSAPTAAPGSSPKVLTFATQRAPVQLFNTLGQPETSVGGATNIFSIPHDLLSVQDDKGNWIPRLAAGQISTDNGTWVLNPDGSMDTTWKLRPNVKWHDGTPFTADDLRFTFDVFKDPDVPNSVGAAIGLMESASVTDPQTFVIHWKAPFIYANRPPA